MSDLRDLMHGAAPNPASPFDPDSVAGRVAKRRRRRAVALGTAMALVAGSTATYVLRNDEGTRPQEVAAEGPKLQEQTFEPGMVRWKVDGARAVAVGDGAVWVAAGATPAPSCPPPVDGSWTCPGPTSTQLVRIDAHTGETELIDPPFSIAHVDVSAGRVWITGPAQGPEAQVVAVYDEASSALLGTYPYCEQPDNGIADCVAFNPQSLVAESDRAWVVSGDFLHRFTLDGDSVRYRGVPHTDNGRIAPPAVVADGVVVVRTKDDDMFVVDPDEARVTSILESAGLLLDAHGRHIWLHAPDGSLHVLGGAAPVVVDVQPTTLSADQRGAWVASADHIARYDVTGALVPGSQIAEPGVTSLASVGDTVFFVSKDGGEVVRFTVAPTLESPTTTVADVAPGVSTTVTTETTVPSATPTSPTPGECAVKEWSVDGQPGSVAVGPDGHFWYTLWEDGAIGRLAADGSTETFDLGDGSKPITIVSGPDGNLWVTDGGRSSIWRISPTGQKKEFPTPTRNANPMGVPGEGSHPAGLTVGPDGNLWFTESFGDKIGRITPEGETTEYPLDDRDRVHANPWAIAAGPDGGVWFVKQLANELVRLDPATGRMTAFTTAGGIGGTAMVAGPDRRLWLPIGQSLTAVTTAGRATSYPVFSEQPWLGPVGSAAGSIWVVEVREGRLARITPSSGAAVDHPLPAGPKERFQSGTGPGMTTAPDGSLVISEPGAGRIARLTCP